MQCLEGEGEQFTMSGWDRRRHELYGCTAGDTCMTERSSSTCNADHFPFKVIMLVVRRYVHDRRSDADMVD